MRKPVRVNQHGLVIPPSKKDCIGEGCPVAEDRGACFTDRHHLYFPAKDRVISPLKLEFALCPENILWIARCAHNRHHNDHDFARYPREEVMQTFLDESKLRQDYFSILRMINVKLEAATDHRLSQDNRKRVQDDLFELWCRHDDLAAAGSQFELIEVDFEPQPMPDIERFLEDVA